MGRCVCDMHRHAPPAHSQLLSGTRAHRFLGCKAFKSSKQLKQQKKKSLSEGGRQRAQASRQGLGAVLQVKPQGNPCNVPQARSFRKARVLLQRAQFRATSLQRFLLVLSKQLFLLLEPVQAGCTPDVVSDTWV